MRSLAVRKRTPLAPVAHNGGPPQGVCPATLPGFFFGRKDEVPKALASAC